MWTVLNHLNSLSVSHRYMHERIGPTPLKPPKASRVQCSNPGPGPAAVLLILDFFFLFKLVHTAFGPRHGIHHILFVHFHLRWSALLLFLFYLFSPCDCQSLSLTGPILPLLP